MNTTSPPWPDDDKIERMQSPGSVVDRVAADDHYPAGVVRFSRSYLRIAMPPWNSRRGRVAVVHLDEQLRVPRAVINRNHELAFVNLFRGSPNTGYR